MKKLYINLGGLVYHVLLFLRFGAREAAHSNVRGSLPNLDTPAVEPQLAEALRYMTEGRGFDSRWCHWKFPLI